MVAGRVDARYADGSEELYDEQADPLKWNSLANDPRHAAVKRELGARMPKVNAPEAPVDKSGGRTRKPGAAGNDR